MKEKIQNHLSFQNFLFSKELCGQKEPFHLICQSGNLLLNDKWWFKQRENVIFTKMASPLFPHKPKFDDEPCRLSIYTFYLVKINR